MEFTRTCSTSFSFFSAITRSRHDVFLSFRGEDTRHNITSQVYRALQEAGIPTFKDDVNLEKGGEIASELLKAIQMSRIAIIVFSRNYADSGWCLDELVKIIECKSEAGLEVLPIFYDVEPGDVQQQRSTYAEAFRKHEERFRSEKMDESKLDRWRVALTEAASSPVAWDMQNVANWHQSKFIKEVVKHILGRRQDAHMSASIFPPRREVAEEYLNLLLSVVSDDILVVGICGVDMTNIAKAVYNQNFAKFEGSCFLANVDEVAQKPDGLLTLQKQFLGDMITEDNIDIDNVKAGTEIIKSALRSKRVLAVLDNVTNLDQFNALARKRKWFGPGSRIVITTRDPLLLNVLEVDDVYGIQGIQVIENQFKENLRAINHQLKYIMMYHMQALGRESSLLNEIEREQKRNTSQAQVIKTLKESLNQGASLDILTATAEVPRSDEWIIQPSEGRSSDSSMINFKP